MRVVFFFLVFIILAVGVFAFIIQALPKGTTLPAPLAKFQKGGELQGYWKLEQFFQEDQTGQLKLIRWSVPGATDNYFLFEGNHICTDGQLDINNNPLRCMNYSTFTLNGNTISMDQPGKPPLKANWTITKDTLELSVVDENQKKGKFVLRRFQKK